MKSKNRKSGTRKYGRNKVKCEVYRKLKSVNNKTRKLRNHLKTYPNDFCAVGALKIAVKVIA